MFRRISLPIALIGLAVAGNSAQAQRPEPMPMGYASLYYQAGVPSAYGTGSWGYWAGWERAGYGLVWRSAHDGGAYPGWWAGPAIVLGPWPPPVGKASPAGGGGAGQVCKEGTSPTGMAGWYDRGFQAYWSGDCAGAVESLGKAAGLGDDARVWYYLSLAQFARGNRPAATEAARYAAALEVLNPGSAGSALERVQGAARAELNRALSAVRTEAEARVVLATRPDPAGKTNPTSEKGTAFAKVR
jgi:hypothetical protein